MQLPNLDDCFARMTRVLQQARGRCLLPEEKNVTQQPCSSKRYGGAPVKLPARSSSMESTADASSLVTAGYSTPSAVRPLYVAMPVPSANVAPSSSLNASSCLGTRLSKLEANRAHVMHALHQEKLSQQTPEVVHHAAAFATSSVAAAARVGNMATAAAQKIHAAVVSVVANRIEKELAKCAGGEAGAPAIVMLHNGQNESFEGAPLHASPSTAAVSKAVAAATKLQRSQDEEKAKMLADRKEQHGFGIFERLYDHGVRRRAALDKEPEQPYSFHPTIGPAPPHRSKPQTLPPAPQLGVSAKKPPQSRGPPVLQPRNARSLVITAVPLRATGASNLPLYQSAPHVDEDDGVTLALPLDKGGHVTPTAGASAVQKAEVEAVAAPPKRALTVTAAAAAPAAVWNRLYAPKPRVADVVNATAERRKAMQQLAAQAKIDAALQRERDRLQRLKDQEGQEERRRLAERNEILKDLNRLRPGLGAPSVTLPTTQATPSHQHNDPRTTPMSYVIPGTSEDAAAVGGGGGSTSLVAMPSGSDNQATPVGSSRALEAEREKASYLKRRADVSFTTAGGESVLGLPPPAPPAASVPPLNNGAPAAVSRVGTSLPTVLAPSGVVGELRIAVPSDSVARALVSNHLSDSAANSLICSTELPLPPQPLVPKKSLRDLLESIGVADGDSAEPTKDMNATRTDAFSSTMPMMEGADHDMADLAAALGHGVPTPAVPPVVVRDASVSPPAQPPIRKPVISRLPLEKIRVRRQ